MKHNNKFYLQLSRELFNEYTYKELPMLSRWIFVVLKEAEQRYTGKNKNFFYRSDADLAADSGLSVRSIQNHKKLLIEYGFIEHWTGHFMIKDENGKDTGKLSEKRISVYRILK